MVDRRWLADENLRSSVQNSKGGWSVNDTGCERYGLNAVANLAASWRSFRVAGARPRCREDCGQNKAIGVSEQLGGKGVNQEALCARLTWHARSSRSLRTQTRKGARSLWASGMAVDTRVCRACVQGTYRSKCAPVAGATASNNSGTTTWSDGTRAKGPRLRCRGFESKIYRQAHERRAVEVRLPRVLRGEGVAVESGPQRRRANLVDDLRMATIGSAKSDLQFCSGQGIFMFDTRFELTAKLRVCRCTFASSASCRCARAMASRAATAPPVPVATHTHTHAIQVRERDRGEGRSVQADERAVKHTCAHESAGVKNEHAAAGVGVGQLHCGEAPRRIEGALAPRGDVRQVEWQGDARARHR